MHVTDPWQRDVAVTDLTDTDLTATRTAPLAVSDPDGEYHRKAEALVNAQLLDEYSAICDRAARIELAYAIDNYVVEFSRDDFDVAYTIPPVGWVEDMETYDVSIPTEMAVEERQINMTTAPVVESMVEAAVEEDAYETKSAVVQRGLDRQLGLVD